MEHYMDGPSYHHSVTLDKEKCRGCTNCLKRCPTEAIRIRNGKAQIMDERCIDCGECIRVCPYHAKVARTDPMLSINRFNYKLALPAPALYGQFKNLSGADKVLAGLRMMGFDAIYEVARGADIVSMAVQRKLESSEAPHPLISSACPAVLRLIQIRFPELIGNIVDVKSPMEVAALMAKRMFCEKTGAPPEEVGAFFITPCAAKMTAVRNPIGHESSAVDGAISVLEVYGLLTSQMKKAFSETVTVDATLHGVGWANSGGEALAAGCDNSLAVDGIQNVSRVLEEIENNKLNDLLFFEGLACPGGCVGGPLVFENSYVAKTRIRKLTENMPKISLAESLAEVDLSSVHIELTEPILPKNVMQLDENITQALIKMERMEVQTRALPGLDCGSCGSPTCRALAEDMAKGQASDMDCIFKLKERVRDLAQRMVELSELTRQ